MVNGSRITPQCLIRWTTDVIVSLSVQFPTRSSAAWEAIPMAKGFSLPSESVS